ncbi:hypothetical protein D3C72_1454010 [compost metagenome]
MRCCAYSTSRRTDSCSRSTSSERRYQNADTMAARNSSTAAIGASIATASCSTGVCLRHHVRHQDSGEALTALRATASGEERGMGGV